MKKEASEWINLMAMNITANTALFGSLIYLFLDYYGILGTHFHFLKHEIAIFSVWIYLFLNVIGASILETIKRNKVKKRCPHCNQKLIIHKYKCEKCEREI